MRISKKEITALISPSGCGKPTLLRCFNRLNDLINHAKISGEITLDGESSNAASTAVVTLRKKIDIVFQNFNLFDHLTALQNVEIALITVLKMKPAESGKRAMVELCRVGMQDWADHYPEMRSEEQAQRASIARALAMDP